MRTQQQGFTLLELLVVLGVIGLVAGSVVALTATALSGQRFALEQDQAVGEAREALFQMIAEMREMRVGETGAYPLEMARPSEIVFYADIDRDDAVERIRYVLENTTLRKEITKPQGTPPHYDAAPTAQKILSATVRNGVNPLLLYYNGEYPQDTANNPLQEPIPLSAVTLIKTTIVINVDPRRPPDDFLLSSFVHIRNTKKNF